MRIHRSNKYTFRTQFLDFDEQPVEPDEDSVRLQVIDEDQLLVTEVPATLSDKTATAEVLSPLKLGHYSLRWTAEFDEQPVEQVEHFELASKPFFHLADLIAFDDTSALGDGDRSKLKRARDEAEDIIERNAGVSFVTRGRRLETIGDGSNVILLPDVKCQRVVSATVDGVGIATSLLTLKPWGELINTVGWSGRIVIHYEHGWRETPEPIKTAALILATSKANLKGVPSRAMSQNTDLGFVRFAIAGRDGYTGIPDVDAAIDQFSRVRPAVG